MFFNFITMSLLVLIPFLAYGAKYLFNIQIAHLLNIELFGDFTLALKTFGIFSAFILLGTGTSAKRFLSEYFKAHDQASSLHYIHWNLRLISEFSLIFITALTSLCLTMVLLHVFDVKSIETYHITFYLLFLAPLGALSMLMSSYMQCNGNTLFSNIFSQGAQYAIYSLLLWGMSYYYDGNYTNSTLWTISLAVLIILNICEALVIAFYFPRSFLKKIFAFKEYRQIPVQPTWKKTANHLILNQLVFLITCTVDLYAVKFFSHNSHIAVGQYSAILTIAGLLFLLSVSIYSTLTSSISYLLSKNDLPALQRMVNNQNLINAVVTTLAAFCILFWGKDLLNTFGPHFGTETTYKALVILTIGYYLGSFTRASAALLSYSGNEIYLVYGSFCELAMIVISASVLTYFYGIIGAAVASSITVCFKSFGYVTVARKVTGIKPMGIM